MSKLNNLVVTDLSGRKGKIVNAMVEVWRREDGSILYFVLGIAVRGRQRFFTLLETKDMNEALDYAEKLNQKLRPDLDALLQEVGIGL